MSERSQIAILEAELEKSKKENAYLRQELATLKKLIFGSKSERYKAEQATNQLNFFAEQESEEVQAEPSIETISYKRKKKVHAGRNKLPENLPVEEIIIEPQQDTTGLKKIGQEITETLKYTKASLVKVRTIRNKYEKAAQQGVLIGDLPLRAMHKCIAEPSLLAHIFVAKFVDHLPFYRQIKMFKRDFNWLLSSSTLNDWFAACCTLLEPTYYQMIEQIKTSGYLQVDESPIKVLESQKDKKSHQGYQWVYYDPLSKIVVFQYRKGRGVQGPKELLSEFKGYLQCDGYKVYDKIGKRPEIKLVGCLAHARRYFHQALDNDKSKAEYALNLFKTIYNADRRWKEENEELTTEKRNEIIGNNIEKLKTWCDNNINKVLPKSSIGKAIGYYLRQYPKLKMIIDTDYLNIDNNLIENKIRPLALGRKNYLFAGNHKSAQNIAMMYSFFATCKAKQKDPGLWLEQTLNNLANPDCQINDLIP